MSSHTSRASTADTPGTAAPSGPVVRVPLAALTPADSPRVRGEDYGHARVLAESDTPLPPVTVHRETMRVVDGMHRLRAARLRGQSEIDVVFFDGDREDAFVLAVTTNVTHGLPLTLEDRTSAATRIVADHPEWSDRRIAAVTGLAATTVGGIRLRSTARSGRSDSRVGSDGRVRPLNGAAGRETAEKLLRKDPSASLRQVAREAGISPSTAHDVRRRMDRGQDPVRTGRRTDGAGPDPSGRGDGAGERPGPVGGVGRPGTGPSRNAATPAFPGPARSAFRGTAPSGPVPSAPPDPALSTFPDAVPSTSPDAVPSTSPDAVPSTSPGAVPSTSSGVVVATAAGTAPSPGAARNAVARSVVTRNGTARNGTTRDGVARGGAGQARDDAGGAVRERRTHLERLSRDPAIRSSEAGRVLVRSLGVGSLGGSRLRELARAVPPHCRGLAADLADDVARSWAALATLLRDLPGLDRA